MALIEDHKFQFWIEKSLNVLFVGAHGVGKSALIIQAFDKADLQWKYFSAATMDPWVDFIGVPKERTDENGDLYLDLVRPKEFQDDAVEAIFIDEYNRAHKKVRNAIMELIQFKSINGRKFKNLRFVWAAVNPHDNKSFSYDVEEIDPAQLDRFHIHVNIPYKPDQEYFISKYGDGNGKAAIEWWESLSNDQKEKVSPRRLDYALEVYMHSGDIADVLPEDIKSNLLKKKLTAGTVMKDLENIFLKRDKKKARKLLEDENKLHSVTPYIYETDERADFFLPEIADERLMVMLATPRPMANTPFNTEVFQHLIRKMATVKKF